MGTLNNMRTTLVGLVLALAAIGCATALAITGHIPGSDAELIITATVTGGGALAGAHVGGNVAVTAAGQSTPAAPVAGDVVGAGATAVQPAAVVQPPAGLTGVTGG